MVGVLEKLLSVPKLIVNDYPTPPALLVAIGSRAESLLDTAVTASQETGYGEMSGGIMMLSRGKRGRTNPVPTSYNQQPEDRVAQDKYPGRSVVVQERF